MRRESECHGPIIGAGNAELVVVPVIEKRKVANRAVTVAHLSSLGVFLSPVVLERFAKPETLSSLSGVLTFGGVVLAATGIHRVGDKIRAKRFRQLALESATTEFESKPVNIDPEKFAEIFEGQSIWSARITQFMGGTRIEAMFSTDQQAPHGKLDWEAMYTVLGIGGDRRYKLVDYTVVLGPGTVKAVIEYDGPSDKAFLATATKIRDLRFVTRLRSSED